MTRNSNILKELNDLKSSLANLGTGTFYTVPQGYFDGLAEKVLNRIKALEATTAKEELSYLSPLLSHSSTQMPYTVPAGYFDTLAEDVFVKNEEIVPAKDELEKLSPLLVGLKKEMPYKVPAGYFDELNMPQQAPAKVVPFRKTWIRYAAAAVITGLIVMTGFLVLNRDNNNEKSLAKFEQKLEKEIDKAPDKELDEFLRQFSDAGLTGDEKASSETANDLGEFLDDVSLDEMKKFLEETSVGELTTDKDVLFMN